MRRVVEAAAGSRGALTHARINEAVDLKRGAVPVPLVKIQKPGHKLHQWVAAKQGREAETAAVRGEKSTCRCGAAEPACTPRWRAERRRQLMGFQRLWL